jgi:murein L,D-transpeptidase YafK
MATIAILRRATPLLGAVLGLLALVPVALSGQQGDQVLLMGLAKSTRTEAPTPRTRTLGFMARQLRYPRVREAFDTRWDRVASLMEAKGVRRPAEVFFRVFKFEQELEVWARDAESDQFTLVKTYPICKLSGRLGPKRREGDGQVPEGFYTIDAFNPWSEYHLSMGVSYPNAVDRARGLPGELGGDIFIHGGCATIGCVPVSDQYIEELYLLAARAREVGQRQIPVHVFPTRLTDAGVRWLESRYGRSHPDFPFWLNLQEGYLAFESTRVPPGVGFEGTRYTFLVPSLLEAADFGLVPVRPL